MVGGETAEAAVVRMHILGDLRGEILLAFSKKNGLAFLDLLKGGPGRPESVFNEMNESVLKEAGSILSASYVKAIGDFLNVTIIHSVPNLMCDKMGVILNDVLEDLAKRAEVAFCIETCFIETSKRINGYFLFIPDVRGLELILKTLGVLGR